MSDSQPLELPRQMRLGMRRLATGISVITTRDASGNRLVMTASSVTSVSDDPVSLLVCIHKSSYLAEAIKFNNCFCINVLAAHQQDISRRCSSPDLKLDRFELGDWQLDENSGLYYLKEALSVFHCEKATELEFGTHFIFVGSIQSVLLQGDKIEPLVYLNGEYVKVEK